MVAESGHQPRPARCQWLPLTQCPPARFMSICLGFSVSSGLPGPQPHHPPSPPSISLAGLGARAMAFSSFKTNTSESSFGDSSRTRPYLWSSEMLNPSFPGVEEPSCCQQPPTADPTSYTSTWNSLECQVHLEPPIFTHAITSDCKTLPSHRCLSKSYSSHREAISSPRSCN